MRFERDLDGAWLVDPDDLARHIGVSSGYLRGQAKRGLIGSRVEPGRGEDEGSHRITIRLTAVAWQAVFDKGGRLVSERRL